MTPDDIVAEIATVIRRTLGDGALDIDASSTAQDVAGWDSLSHVQIVVGVERRFKIRFAAREIMSFKNVGEMAATVHGRLAAP